MQDSVEGRGGTVVEIRGDEALAVFTSPRQAIRAAVDLQARFDEETEADSELPLRVGIGIDSGEAILLDDGSYRGGALNVAARLCGRAHGGEVLLSEGTSRLAGRLPGISYVDRGRAHLKNISEPIHTFAVRSEREPATANRWVLMFFGRPGRTFGWKLGMAVVLIAAITAGAVVYLTARGPETTQGAGKTTPSTTMGEGGSSGSMTTTDHTMTTRARSNLPPLEQLMSYATENKWTCSDLGAIQPGARAALACSTQSQTYPVVFQMTLFRNERILRNAYAAELRQANIRPNTGDCTPDAWGGEIEWFHGIGEPGGRAFCHLDEADQRAYLTWTSDAGKKILVVAQLNGLQHRRLFFWWRNVRHDLV